MGSHGFITLRKKKERERRIGERIADFREVTLPPAQTDLREQAARCIDCGIPFCHRGCPLGNLIPEWNQLVTEGKLDEAAARLEQTNNFPEITGRICPAPCEAACVLEIERDSVSIKMIERGLADRIIEAGLRSAARTPRTGRSVGIVGSGPAGLAAAQELARGGHDVVVFERADRVGGLMRYGIPDFKLEKDVIDMRVEQLREEGVVFRTGEAPSVSALREFDAVVLAIGARRPRELHVPGRELQGVHLAMDYLEQQNRRVAGDVVKDGIDARGRTVVVIGSGDTGSDCVGTAIRQGAKSVMQLAYKNAPSTERSTNNPWPEWPLIFRTSSSQEEGAAREWAVVTRGFRGANGALEAIEAVRLEDEARIEIPCDLALLALGYVGPEGDRFLTGLGVGLDARGNVRTDESCATDAPGIFAAGDASRGASLVVWAIADGRRAAAAVEAYFQKRR